MQVRRNVAVVGSAENDKGVIEFQGTCPKGVSTNQGLSGNACNYCCDTRASHVVKDMCASFCPASSMLA